MDRKLFIRYFNGKATEEECSQLHAWIEESNENKEEFLKQRKLWDMLLMNTPAETLKASLENAEEISGRKIRNLKLVFAYAASALILIGASWFLSKIYNKENVHPLAYQTINVPIGQRVQLTLADGSRVWLNSKSQFSFPAGFASDKREVFLNGEAYFEVAHNAKQAFVVNTRNYNLQVHGTSFNVYAYSETRVFETALITGSLSVVSKENPEKSVLLKPGEKVIQLKKGLKVYKSEVGNDVLWKDGIYFFNDIHFGEMLQRLERYYDVEVVVQKPEVLNYSCTGKFRQDEDVENILNVVRVDNPFKFHFDKKKRLITIL